MKPLYIKLLTIIAISSLGIIVYSNTFLCSFHFDDIPAIVDNFFIRNIYNLKNIWKFCPCRFVTFYSIAVNYHFHQLNVFGYRLFNLAIHLGSAILVWWFTLLTFSTPAMKEEKIARHANVIALFAGLVFVTHPVQTEAVTYIWQRATSMATLFYLASLVFYVKSRLLQVNNPISGFGPHDGHSSLLGKYYYIFSLIITIVAMFTKEIAITFPLIILLYEYSFLKTKINLNWKYLSPFLLTLFIIPLTMLHTASIDAQHIRGVVPDEPSNISPVHYLLTQFRVVVTCIRLVFLPLNQNLDYDYPIFKNFFELPVLISFLFLITILYWAKCLFLKYRLVSFSILWFFLTLLPESSFLPLQDVIFEHRLYLPLVGYSIFLVSSMYYFFGKNNLKTMMVALTMIITCYSVMTYQRNKVWKDEVVLWSDSVRKSPHKTRPYNNRGLAYFNQGNLAQALSDYNKVIEINPYYADAYNNRGLVYDHQGNLTQALSDYNKAIEINSNYADAYNNRGIFYARHGNFTQAMPDFTRAIEINSNYAGAYNNRGLAYFNQGNLNQALSNYNKAIEINSIYAEAYYNRAITYYQLKEYGKAWADVHKAEELRAAVNPAFISALKQATEKTK